MCLSTVHERKTSATLPVRHRRAFTEQHGSYLIRGVTTTPDRSTGRRMPTREQCVAALLVGAVVVLLGFASGLGLGPAAGTAQSAPAPMPGGGTSSSATAPATTTSIAAPPVAYVVEPAAPQPIGIAAPSSPAATPAPVTTSPPGSPAVPSPGPSSTAPAPACSSGLLTGLLNTLLPGQSAVAGLPLLGLGALLDSLAGIGSSLTTLLGLDPAQLLGQVSDALAVPGVVPAATPASEPAVAHACTVAVAQALPVLAAGGTVAGAVRTVEASRR